MRRHYQTLHLQGPQGAPILPGDLRDPKGSTPQGTSVPIVVSGNPEPEAGGRLRMDLWSGLQSEMDQGSDAEC